MPSKLEIIVTGFDPFGEFSVNPSEVVAASMPTTVNLVDAGKERQATLSAFTLPTCCSDSWKSLEAELKSRADRTIVLVMLGLAEPRVDIEMERVALNLRDYRFADNKGHQPPVEKIVEEAENALFSLIDLKGLKERITQKGCPISVSNHAGTYVCNEIYFRSLIYQKENPHLSKTLFVHLPGNLEIGDGSDEEKLSIMRATVLTLVEELAKESLQEMEMLA